MEKGYLAIVLHAHLPFVRHPEYERFLEEDWLFEAITETYIPLIEIFEQFIDAGIKFKLTISVTPTLAAMLRDNLLQNKYLKHIERLIELSEKEVIRTRWMPDFNRTAEMYKRKFYQARKIFVEHYNKDLTKAFKAFQDYGVLEIITCGATHGFLPLMTINPAATRAQIAIATAYYKEVFQTNPTGIWLPECGYSPNIDWFLKEHGIRYFFTDTHGILHGSPRPKYGVFAPVYCPSGVAAFGRDIESSKAVWSAIEGYPGDYNYREFYRDIGYDLDYEYVKPYLHPIGIRTNLGIKYYKITGKTDHKEPYDEQKALEVAAIHAGNFMFNREKQIEYLYEFLNKKPIIVSPYDAELFGHWWYEGPQFIYFLIKKIYYDQKTIRLVTPSEYLSENPKNQVVVPSMSSWGYKGYCEVWLEGSNDWIYRHLHKSADYMVELADSFQPPTDGLVNRALKQAARELLLAQSSDWAFIMKTRTAVEYATKRTITHINRFLKLHWQIKNNQIDENWLSEIEWQDNIFPNIDWTEYKSEKVKGVKL